MTSFFAFALYLCFGTLILVIAPVTMVPGLSLRRKLLICVFAFLLIVPGGLGAYALLGAPPMASYPQG